MTKLWKVTVNDYGWDSPSTYYFKNREEANEYRRRRPTSEDVK